MLPPFTNNGLLPRGIHWTSWDEITRRFGYTPWRRKLLDGLIEATNLLAQAGCRAIYIDGSFVTQKSTPGDFDACWDIEGVDLAKLDPVLLTFDPGRASQKQRFGGELFPAQLSAEASYPYRRFLEFFQTDKETGKEKGIVALKLIGEKP